MKRLAPLALVTLALAPATAVAGEPPLAARTLELLRGFRFGSYGRIGISGDLRRGGKGEPLNVVSHGPRLEEPPYVELDLGYALERDDALSLRVVTTVAFFEDFFHYNGRFEAKLALRNLYVEADHVLTRHLGLWVGSRMYRGDDIYLLDFWPLDNLNTLGAGARLSFGNTEIRLHGGANRLEQEDYQLQRIDVVDPRDGTEEVTVLDRQRAVFSLKAEQRLPRLWRGLGLKAALYGELHHLPSGSRRRELETEELPADWGWVVGAQLGAWGLGENGFVNVWARVAGGLAAFGELTVPDGLSPQKRAGLAREVRLALSGNFERGLLGVMFGGYLRYFADADGVASDFDDGWEYALAVRPHLFFHRYFHQLFEVSIQGRRPDGLHPRTQTHLVPTVIKLSAMPALTWERGSYARPQIRLVYTLSILDKGARLSFAPEDPRYDVAVHHFLGIQAEWWFNSSYR